jgi:trigger factor
MEIGDVKDLNLKFPENYNPELAGKEVVFTVTLDEIWEVPELTDEMCAEYTGYSTASAYVESIKTDGIFEYAWNQLVQQCKIKAYPDEYTEYYQSYVNYFTDIASRYSVSFEDFLQTYASYYSNYGLYSGMTTAQFYMVAENYAESNLVNDLLMYSLLRAEGITVGGEAFEVAKDRLELEYGVSYEELKETYESTSVIISVLNIALANRLCEYVTIVK